MSNVATCTTAGWSPGMKLDDVEKETILAAYQYYHQNKTQTAASLGIAIRTLDYKLAKYRGESPAPEKEPAHEV
jgi:transcriptional regulator with PAS, ATPase and Fis domain